MALNIKDPVTEKLAAEVALLAGETKTGAIRKSLLERKDRLSLRKPHADREAGLRRFLEDEVWPLLPGTRRRKLTKKQREAILGYGPEGV
ncbi:MAG: type II toxin-antitoxin system VapB family antitoxin [Holophagales bacterium]|nr:type II toxin-antitoxin system VapB family antitoxin [Holophagales bacterium]